MGGTLFCNGWDTVLYWIGFLFKQSPNGLGLCPAMGGALSCTGLDFFSKQSPNGWGIVL